MVQSGSVDTVALKLYDLRDEGFGVVNEGASYNYFCIFKLFGLSAFSICRSSHIEYNHYWLISTITLSPSESSPVFTLFHSFLQKLRKNILKQIRLVLSVNTRNILEDSFEVADGLLFEIPCVKKIGLSILLILLKKGGKRGHAIVGMCGVEEGQKFFDFFVIGVLDGEQDDQFQFEVVLYLVVFQDLPDGLDAILPAVLADQVLLHPRHFINLAFLDLRRNLRVQVQMLLHRCVQCRQFRHFAQDVMHIFQALNLHALVSLHGEFFEESLQILDNMS